MATNIIKKKPNAAAEKRELDILAAYRTKDDGRTFNANTLRNRRHEYPGDALLRGHQMPVNSIVDKVSAKLAETYGITKYNNLIPMDAINNIAKRSDLSVGANADGGFTVQNTITKTSSLDFLYPNTATLKAGLTTIGMKFPLELETVLMLEFRIPLKPFADESGARRSYRGGKKEAQ